jgi:hypothetical protein
MNTPPDRSPLSEFADDGIPDHLPVADWLVLASSIDSRALQAILRFSRADGSIVFGPTGRSQERLKRLDLLASQLGDPSLAGVVARWHPTSQSTMLPPSTPPLPSYSRLDRPLAILRPDWTPRGDHLAIDHRLAGSTSLLEVASKGQVWLGPSWSSSLLDGKCTQPRPSAWTSTPFAMSLEWKFTAGSARVTRDVTLIRGRSLAILGQEVEGPARESEIRLGLASGVSAEFVSGSRAIQLSSGPGKPSSRLLPLGLPEHDRPTDRGSITIDGREIVIRQTSEGRRNWLSVLLAWDKPPQTWRPLTVAYRSKATKADQAVATRVAWGARDPGLVIYRSLAPPELRSFLGHQTSARYLVGTFTRTGEVLPILKVM